MIRDFAVTTGSAAASDPLRVDPNQAAFGLGAFLTVTGTNTSTVQYTTTRPNTDPNNATAAADNFTGAVWVDITDLTDITATSSAKVDTNVQAIRINTTSWTNGSASLTAQQGYQS